jgi:hypothetical protein
MGSVFRTRKQAILAFRKQVKKMPSGCWEWQGWLNTFGYGGFMYLRKAWRAHRFSWFITYGLLPQGLLCLHKCDNRKCVRPSHLFLGTYKDNEQDKISKGRKVCNKGDDCNLSKLTAQKVIQLREDFKNGTDRQALSKKYKIGRDNISAILRRKTWKHI